MRYCRFCGTKVEDEVVICPSCGKAIPNDSYSKQLDTKPVERQGELVANNAEVDNGKLVVSSYSASNISYPSTSVPNMEITDHNNEERMQAALFAQSIELKVLKAPATAVFPPLDTMVISGSNGIYNVSGYVDSQNSYGAMIRSTFTYNVEKTPEGWRCTDTFESTETSIAKQMAGNTILYWILSIIGTIIMYFIIRRSIWSEYNSILENLMDSFGL